MGIDGHGSVLGRALGFCAVGATLLCFACVVALAVVQDQLTSAVSSTAVIKGSSSDEYSSWKDPRGIFTSFYVLNLTNPEDLPNGGLPRYTEHGPFVYESRRTKLDPEFDLASDSVTYYEQNWFTFRRDLSVAEDDFMITTLNIPLWGVLGQAESSSEGAIIGAIISQEYLAPRNLSNNAQLLYTTTRQLREILFGYDDPLLAVLHGAIAQIPPTFPGLQPNETEAVARGQGLLRASIGSRNHSTISQLDMWNNQTFIKLAPAWTTEEASRVYGSSGHDFGHSLQPGSSVPIFIDQLRRGASLENVGSVRADVKGIDTLRYVLPETLLQNASENAANADYHMTLGHGVLPLRTAYDLAPLVATKPHFYDSFATLEARGRSMGLAPTPDAHETFLNMEPFTGLPLEFHKRLMFSIDAKPAVLGDLHLLPEVNRGLLPVLWADEHFVLTDGDVDDLRPLVVANALAFGVLPALIAASAALALAFIVAYGVVAARREGLRPAREASVTPLYSSI